MKSNVLIFFTISQLYKQRVHLGVLRSNMHTNALRYMLPIKSKFSFVDLHYTSTLLKVSFNYIINILERRGNILLVNESPFLVNALKKEFETLQQPISYSNWPSGLLSNFKAVRKNSLKTYFLKKQFILKLFKLDSLGLLNSKVRNIIKASFNFLKFKKELNRYIRSLNRLPNMIFVLNSVLSDIALQEAKRVGITRFGICDNNADAFSLNYAIPGNSTSIQSLTLYFKFLKLTFLKGVLLERRNFLNRCLLKKRAYRGLNFLLSRVNADNITVSLSSFSHFFLKKGFVLNPYLSIYRSNLTFYKKVNMLNLFLKKQATFLERYSTSINSIFQAQLLNPKQEFDLSSFAVVDTNFSELSLVTSKVFLDQSLTRVLYSSGSHYKLDDSFGSVGAVLPKLESKNLLLSTITPFKASLLTSLRV